MQSKIKRNTISRLLPLLVLLLVSGLVFLGYSKISDKHCRDSLKKVYDLQKAPYPLRVCELEKFQTDNGQTVTKLYAVISEYDRSMLHECGFYGKCYRDTIVKWFDDQGRVIDVSIPSPPQSIAEDPAVLALGCAQRNVSRSSDPVIDPVLTKTDDEYRWKITYSDTPTTDDSDNAQQSLGCVLNGYSLIGHRSAEKMNSQNDTQADLTATYTFDPKTCTAGGPDGSICLTARSVLSGDYRDCLYEFNFTTGNATKLDGLCAESYYTRTGDTTVCGMETDFIGPLDCSGLSIVKGTLKGRNSF